MTSYSNWHIPLASNDIILQAALDSLHQIRESSKTEIDLHQPHWLMSKFAEMNQTEFDSFKNIDGNTQDYFHILLGRGFLAMDEIFVAGFTLGTIKKVINTEQAVYSLVARYLVPDVCDFNEQEMLVFKDAIRLAFISNCSPLDQFNFREWLDQPIASIRDAVGVEEELLHAFYAVEKRRNPTTQASQRLLPLEQNVVAF